MGGSGNPARYCYGGKEVATEIGEDGKVSKSVEHLLMTGCVRAHRVLKIARLFAAQTHEAGSMGRKPSTRKTNRTHHHQPSPPPRSSPRPSLNDTKTNPHSLYFQRSYTRRSLSSSSSSTSRSSSSSSSSFTDYASSKSSKKSPSNSNQPCMSVCVRGRFLPLTNVILLLDNIQPPW